MDIKERMANVGMTQVDMILELQKRGYYIGYCADEERRFNKRLSAKKLEIYPLAENGINEDVILEWAKTQPIFNHYYEINQRCGCMYCPMSSYLNFAYLYKYYTV